MKKIQSIESMEKIFLDASSVDDIGIDRNIALMIGMDYREMEIPNFETNVFSPDIPVADGVDAMTVALEGIKNICRKNKF